MRTTVPRMWLDFTPCVWLALCLVYKGRTVSQGSFENLVLFLCKHETSPERVCVQSWRWLLQKVFCYEARVGQAEMWASTGYGWEAGLDS